MDDDAHPTYLLVRSPTHGLQRHPLDATLVARVSVDGQPRVLAGRLLRADRNLVAPKVERVVERADGRAAPLGEAHQLEVAEQVRDDGELRGNGGGGRRERGSRGRDERRASGGQQPRSPRGSRPL